jgi:hypothetical protein
MTPPATDDTDDVAALVARHHGAVALLAGALAPAGDDGSAADRTAVEAWQSVLGGTDGRDGAGLSFAVRVLAAVVDRTPDDGVDAEVDDDLATRPLFPPGHRWAGWRSDDPAEWPSPTGAGGADPATAVRALRRLPAIHRAVVVLRDVAGIGVVETAAVLGGTHHEQAAVLDDARLRLVASLDLDLGTHPS